MTEIINLLVIIVIVLISPPMIGLVSFLIWRVVNNKRHREWMTFFETGEMSDRVRKEIEIMKR